MTATPQQRAIALWRQGQSHQAIARATGIKLWRVQRILYLAACEQALAAVERGR